MFYSEGPLTLFLGPIAMVWGSTSAYGGHLSNVRDHGNETLYVLWMAAFIVLELGLELFLS